MLQVSAAHVYLTYPFVLSWSMLEAMAAGCLLVGSDTAPVREVLRDGENGHLVDFFDVQGMAHKVLEILHSPQQQMRCAPRRAETLGPLRHSPRRRGLPKPALRARSAALSTKGRRSQGQSTPRCASVVSEATDGAIQRGSSSTCRMRSRSHRWAGSALCRGCHAMRMASRGP